MIILTLNPVFCIVYISVTQSKLILVCVCAYVRVRARAYVKTCVGLCVCAFWSIQMEHTNVHTGLCFGSCRIFCKGPSF